MTRTCLHGSALAETILMMVQRNIQSLNPKFRIDIRPLQWSTMLDGYSTRKFPMLNGRWALDFADPHGSIFGLMHSSGYYAKGQGYANPQADRLIEEAVRELDPEKRRALYAKLQEIAHEDVPQIYTLDTSNVEALRSWVKGWTYNPIVLYGYFYPVFKAE